MIRRDTQMGVAWRLSGYMLLSFVVAIATVTTGLVVFAAPPTWFKLFAAVIDVWMGILAGVVIHLLYDDGQTRR